MALQNRKIREQNATKDVQKLRGFGFEVDFEYFENNFWNHDNLHGYAKNFSAASVWREIFSVIKGAFY